MEPWQVNTLRPSIVDFKLICHGPQRAEQWCDLSGGKAEPLCSQYLTPSSDSPAPSIPHEFALPPLLKAALTILIFSSAPACVRMVELNAYTLGIVRLGLASLGMTVLVIAKGELTWKKMSNWDRPTWWALISVGIMFGLHWLTFFLSIKLASAAIGAIGFSTYGLHLLLMGWILGFGSVKLLDIMGLMLACLGTYLLIPEFSLENDQTLGLLIGIISGLAAAMLPLLHQHHVKVDTNLRAWGQFTFALPVFLLCWPLTDWEIVPRDIPLILYLSLGIALVGHGMWVHVTSVLSTTIISVLSYLYLPTSLLFGFLVLGDSERLSGRTLIGTVLVLIANALVMWSQARIRAIEAEVVETV
ncbi:EamA-like transporter family protein [Bythopirellula polymerisocia]|uniref:EamA-like transporter family protein n=2 Tax=Bythopirellula polymerisocia TaxID=2528003 RepID=A0A5C6CQY2_9BACT|nr:EamA-like transporter family protein [Bythopirellula polymerisocia]